MANWARIYRLLTNIVDEPRTPRDEGDRDMRDAVVMGLVDHSPRFGWLLTDAGEAWRETHQNAEKANRARRRASSRARAAGAEVAS